MQKKRTIIVLPTPFLSVTFALKKQDPRWSDSVRPRPMRRQVEDDIQMTRFSVRLRFKVISW